MSTLFISYNTKDRPTAEIVYQRLVEMGYQKPFRDDHPASGIPAGSDWEQELYRKLKLCRALIVLCSKNWLESKWCFAELAYAKAMGKAIFPVLIDDSLEVPNTVAEQQTIKFSDSDVWERLRRGLVEANLGPHSDFVWPVAGFGECPYPGLAAFEAHHAGVYFGRGDEILEVCERLNQMRSRGKPRLLYIVGASGSGKSSLVKAGVLPILTRKESGRWCVFRTFRWNELRAAGRDWPEQLAVSLIAAWPLAGAPKPDWKALRQRYCVVPSSGRINSDNVPMEYRSVVQRAADQFIDDTKELLLALQQPDATPILVIDQFEEILSATDDDSVKAFLDFLGAVMGSPRSPWCGLATIRSEFLATIQTRPEMIAWKDQADLYSLPLMKPDRFYEVIRRPAEKVGIHFESDALVDQIVRDTGGNDALPLLAFALRELYERYGEDKQFTFDEYTSKLGGLEGCLTQVADELFSEPVDPASSALSHSLQRKLLVAFSSHLVRINDEDEKQPYVRRAALWSAFLPEVQAVLKRFIERRLITSRPRDESNPRSEQVIEVTHEALFRKWQTLERWLSVRRDLLRWRQDVDRTRSAEGARWSGLTRSQLAVANDWPSHRGEELTADELLWIRAAKRGAAIRSGALVVTALVVGLLAIATYFTNRRLTSTNTSLSAKQSELQSANSNLIAQTLAATRAAAFANCRRLLAWSDAVQADSPQRSLLLAMEAQLLARQNNIVAPEIEQALRDRLTLYSGLPIHEFGGGFIPVRFSPDGRWLIAGSKKGAPLLLDLKKTRSSKPVITLEAHEGAITDLAFSPDGRWLVTGSADDRARIWDLHYSGKSPGATILAGHVDEITAVAIAPDNGFVATASKDATIRIWSISNPTAPSQVIRDFEDAVSDLEISSDGRWMAAGSANPRGRALVLWNLKNGNPFVDPIALPTDDAPVTRVSFAGGNRWLLATLEGGIILFDLSADNPARFPLPAFHSDASTSLSPDGRWLAYALRTPSSSPFLLDLANGASPGPPIELRGHRAQSRFGGSRSFVFSADGEWLVTQGDDDPTALLWRLTGGGPPSEAFKLGGHGGEVWGMAISPDSHWLVTTARDAKVAYLWDLTLPDPSVGYTVLRGADHALWDTAFSPDGNWLYARGLGDDYLHLWEAPFQTTPGETIAFADIEVHPDAVELESVGTDIRFTSWRGESIRLRDIAVDDLQIQSRILPHREQVLRAANSMDGRWLAARGENFIRLWSLNQTNGFRDASVDLPDVSPGGAVVISPGGRFLASGVGSRERKAIALWDLTSANPSGSRISMDSLTGKTPEMGIFSLPAFSQNDKWILAIGDRRLTLCNLTAQPPQTVDLTNAQQRITSIAFSGDARWLATGAEDHTISIWNLDHPEIHKSLRVLRGHAGSIQALRFTPDSTRLVSICGERLEPGSGGMMNVHPGDKTARIWPVETADASPALVLRGHDGDLLCLDISPDGQYLVTGGKDGTLRRWDLKAANPSISQVVLGAHKIGGKTFEVTKVAIAGNGKRVFSWGADLRLRVCNLDDDNILEAARQLTGRNLDTREWKQFFPDRTNYTKTLDAFPIHSTLAHEARNAILNQSMEQALDAADPGLRRELSAAVTQVLLDEGRRWAEEGQIAKAEETLELTRRLAGEAPAAKLDEWKRIAARAHRRRGVDLLNYYEPQIARAIDTFRAAVALDPNLGLDPEKHALQVLAGRYADELQELGDLRISSSSTTPEKAVITWRRAIEAVGTDGKLAATLSEVALKGVQTRAMDAFAQPETLVGEADFVRPLRGFEWCESAIEIGEVSMPPKDNESRWWIFAALAGRRLASEDLDGATEMLRRAQAVEPALRLEPSRIVGQLDMIKRLRDANPLLTSGRIEEALEAYNRIRAKYPEIDLPAGAWNELCWRGCLHGKAALVKFAGDRAVALAGEDRPSQYAYIDTRGLARALTGDFEGAIADFEIFLKGYPDSKERAEWLSELRKGRQPITDQVLRRLREE